MDDDRYCPYFHHAVELLGRRWSGVILKVLAASGPMRFRDIRDRVPGLSDRLLTSRLGELEAEGIVARCEHDGISCYGLTSKGRGLEPVLDAVARVSHEWARAEAPAPRPGRIRT